MIGVIKRLWTAAIIISTLMAAYSAAQIIDYQHDQVVASWAIDYSYYNK